HGLADDDKFWFRQRVGGGFYILRGAEVELEKVAVIHCEAYRIDRNDSYITGAGIGVVLSDLRVDSSLLAHNVIGRDMRDKGIGAGAAIYALGGVGNELVITNSTVSNNQMNLKSGASSHAGAVFVSQSAFGFHPQPVKPRGRKDEDDDDEDGDDEDGDDKDDRVKGNGRDDKNGKGNSGGNRGDGDDDDEDEELSHHAFFGSLIDDREYDDQRYHPWDFSGIHANDGWNGGDDDGKHWKSRARFIVRVESSTIADNFAYKGCAGFVSRNRPQKVLLKNTIFARNRKAGHWRFPDRVRIENFHQRGSSRKFPRVLSLGGNVFDDRSGRPFLNSANDIEVTAGELGLGELGDYGGPTATQALEEGSLAIGNAIEGAPLFDQRCLVRTDPEDSGAFEFGAGEGGGGNTAPFVELAIADVRVPCDSDPVTIPLHVHFGDAEDADVALVFELTGNTAPGVVSAAPVVAGTGELVLEFLEIVGVSELKVVVTDTGGLIAEASFGVEVLDTKPPVLVGVPDDTVVPSQQGLNGA
ncbi:MAG: choice-of-anchor Q domain-containing protein, partial [Verrucomicrobiales bacterium]|nr:choice-of-anchor Q domain-containing protein [Verrucomicrobiales bacterium]